MSVSILLFTILMLMSNIVYTQDAIQLDSAIDFPTINLDGNPDENITDHSEQAPDNYRKKKKKNELVVTESYGFYTDIIIGGIVLLIALIGWKVYQRFRMN